MSVDSSSEAKSIYQLANRRTCIEVYKYIITSKTFKKSEKYEDKKKKKISLNRGSSKICRR